MRNSIIQLSLSVLVLTLLLSPARADSADQPTGPSIDEAAETAVNMVDAFSETDFKIDPIQFAKSLRLGAGRAGLTNDDLVVLLDQPRAATAQADSTSYLIEQTQADYCRHLTCGDLQDQFFLRLHEFWSPTRAHGEHAMMGSTAGNLFVDPKLAGLARAACLGQADGVSAAVRNGADPNGIGAEGIQEGATLVVVTPLIWAIDCDSPTGVEALIRAGADVNRSGKYGVTPVTEAANRADPALLAVLLKNGGDPSAHTDRDTALEIALQKGLELAVQPAPADRAWANWNALLTAGADIYQVVGGGHQTIAVRAAMENQFDKVLELLDRGYSRDLEEVGRWVEFSEKINRLPPGEVGPRAEVKERLIKAGVVFPIVRRQ